MCIFWKCSVYYVREVKLAAQGASFSRMATERQICWSNYSKTAFLSSTPRRLEFGAGSKTFALTGYSFIILEKKKLNFGFCQVVWIFLLLQQVGPPLRQTLFQHALSWKLVNGCHLSHLQVSKMKLWASGWSAAVSTLCFDFFQEVAFGNGH